MKKKVFMKIMSSITLLCLGAHAGLMIGKPIRKKKDEEWEGGGLCPDQYPYVAGRCRYI